MRGGGIGPCSTFSGVGSAGHALPYGACLLIDGESPAGTRWVLGLAVLLLGFAAFNLVGLIRLARPVRDADAVSSGA